MYLPGIIQWYSCIAVYSDPIHAYEYAYHQFIHTVVELKKYEWEKLFTALSL